MTTLALIGAGHAHAQVLLEFARRPENGLRIVLVSPQALAPYSGMVPGWLAGHYLWDECCLDFQHLCERTGARMVCQSVVAADLSLRALLLDDGQRIDFDLLSVDIGSTLRPPANTDKVLAMRPLANLHERWDNLVRRIRDLPTGAAHRVVMIGGGAAGVESILAAHRRLTTAAPHADIDFTLATRDAGILPGLAKGAARRLAAHLDACSVRLVTGFAAADIADSAITDGTGRTLPFDTLLWATGAEAHRWPRAAGLDCDAHGFIRIDTHLRSLSHPRVFAAGDCAAWPDGLPKAGVYAVRMGPVLAHNLRAAMLGRPSIAYRPQKRHLVLIGTGESHAVGAWGPLAWQGQWVWRWKQRIDRRFLDRYR